MAARFYVLQACFFFLWVVHLGALTWWVVQKNKRGANAVSSQGKQGDRTSSMKSILPVLDIKISPFSSDLILQQSLPAVYVLEPF